MKSRTDIRVDDHGEHANILVTATVLFNDLLPLSTAPTFEG